MTCSSSLNPFTKSLCDRRNLTNYFLSNSARNIRRSHPTITHTDPANHDELSPPLLGRYRHHPFSLLGDRVERLQRLVCHRASTALPPSRPVTCSETELISKISPQQTRRQLLPPQHRTLSLATSHIGTKFSYCVTGLGHLPLAHPMLVLSIAAERWQRGSGIPSSPRDAAAPYLVSASRTNARSFAYLSLYRFFLLVYLWQLHGQLQMKYGPILDPNGMYGNTGYCASMLVGNDSPNIPRYPSY
ncbi:hypothetical protein EDB85DRAFT_1928050 [Lactarius pseudohatsudake]|nr:hypothetical protein EDB85DRAFT_1928050 [Lactarius pseudohatsudake]